MKKWKTYKYLGSLLTNQNAIQDEIKCDSKQEIHVIIQPKHICLLDFSLRILILKYIKLRWARHVER